MWSDKPFVDIQNYMVAARHVKSLEKRAVVMATIQLWTDRLQVTR